MTFGCLDQYAKIEKGMTMRSFLQSAFAELYQMEKEMTLAYEKAAARRAEGKSDIGKITFGKTGCAPA